MITNIQSNISAVQNQNYLSSSELVLVFLWFPPISFIYLISNIITQILWILLHHSQLILSTIAPHMKQKYLKPVIFASVVIMFYQAIANTILGIISQFTHQNNNDWAGPYTTALLFIGSGIGCIYNQYIGKYQYKYCFFFGAFGYITFCCLGLIFLKIGFSTGTLILIFVLSFLAGLLCSIFYNTQFNYINTLAKVDKREVKYFGINMGIVQSCNIIGNLLSAVLITPLGQFYYVLVMDAAILGVSFLFLFFKEPEKQQVREISQQYEKPSIIEENLNPQNQVRSLKASKFKLPPLKACSAFGLSGAIISYIYCILGIQIYRNFQDIMTESELNRFTFTIFIFEGVGEFLGGLAVILYSNKIKDTPKFIMISNVLFVLSMSIVYVGCHQQNQIVTGIGALCIGFCDCSEFSLALSLAGRWEKNGITGFNLFQSGSVALNSILAVYIPIEATLAIIIAICVWNIVGMQLFRKENKLEIKKEESDAPA